MVHASSTCSGDVLALSCAHAPARSAATLLVSISASFSCMQKMRLHASCMSRREKYATLRLGRPSRPARPDSWYRPSRLQGMSQCTTLRSSGRQRASSAQASGACAAARHGRLCSPAHVALVDALRCGHCVGLPAHMQHGEAGTQCAMLPQREC